MTDRIVWSVSKMVRVLSSDVLCASFAVSCLALHTRLTLLDAAALLALSLFSQLGSLVRRRRVHMWLQLFRSVAPAVVAAYI